MRLASLFVALSLYFSGVLTAQSTAARKPAPTGPALTNEDVVKLTRAGMSEEFILDVVKTKGGAFRTDASSLIALKEQGVSESLIAAMVRKTPPSEPWNSDTVVRLTKAGFSEQFLLQGVKTNSGQYATDTGRLVELKEAGVSEAVMEAMVRRTGGNKIPAGVTIAVRTIDSIDSSKANVGDTFRASLEEPLTLAGEVVAPKGANVTLAVVEETQSGKLAGRTSLGLQLVSIQIRNREVKVDTDPLTKESGSRGRKTATRALVLSGVGAAIGGIAGGGSGAAIGAASGAGAGVGTQVITKGERVYVPSETVLRFTTRAPLSI